MFSKQETAEDDPVEQALKQYKKDMVMDQQEEERLERLQKEREKQVGAVKEGLEHLPQNGYSLYSKFRSIEN